MWYPLWDQNQVIPTTNTLAETLGSLCKAQRRSGGDGGGTQQAANSSPAKVTTAVAVENQQQPATVVNYEAVIEFLKNPARVTSVDEVTATLDRIGEFTCCGYQLPLLWYSYT